MQYGAVDRIRRRIYQVVDDYIGQFHGKRVDTARPMAMTARRQLQLFPIKRYELVAILLAIFLERRRINRRDRNL